MPANPAVVRRVASLTLGTFVLAVTTPVWGQSPKWPRFMPSHSIVRAASDVSAPAFAGEFEVWVVDQSNSPGVSYGGTIHIYEGSDLIGEAAGSAAPTDVVNLGAATAALCLQETGANPVRPHMVYFNSTHRHAILAFVASGHVVIFDAASRTPLSCIRTSVGAGGARQAHAAIPAPNDSYILVANQNGKLLERISTDYSTNTFALDPAATLNLATCTTPNGAACQAPGIRPDNAPIIASVDSSSALGFVTLRGGGMFVVNATATPMAILGEYDNATVHPNGMGAVEVRGWMFINSGGGSSANLSEFDVYRFPLSGYAASNPPNTPPPQVLFSDDNTIMERDSHGTVVTRYGRYLWVGDRAGNVAEVFDVASGAHVNTVDLTGPESDDPTPDYADISPSGERIFFALRGPNPLTGDAHVATGSTPGLGVVQVNSGGADGFLQAVVRISNLDTSGPIPVERADPHGIRVRMKSPISSDSARVLPPHSIVPPTPEGKSIGAWTMDWNVWGDNVPFPDDAHSDTTGANANNGQPDGPVFFLGQTLYGETTVERTFTVPAGKYILVPLMYLAGAEAFGDKQCATPEGCRQVVADAIPLIDDLFYGIDGVNGVSFFFYREPFPDVFQYEIGENDPFGWPPGPTGNVFCDGYWIMLAPLSEGQQLDLVYGGGISSFSFSYRVTAHITGASVDCNGNGYLDSCDISCTAPGGKCDPLHCFVSDDCDGNFIPDECEADCWPTDAPNEIPDYCDVLSCPAGNAACADCNGNRVPDECDTFIGFSVDCQSDGIPDECQTSGEVTTFWAADSGSWNVGDNWCPSLTPEFPDNSVGTSYDVTIAGAESVVTLNTSPSVDSLSLTGGATVVVNDAGGANVRTLHSDGDITNSGIFRATDRERLVLDASVIDQGSQCGEGGVLEAIDGVLGEGEQSDKSILEVNGARVLGGIARTIGNNSEIHLIGGAELVDVCIDGVVIPDGQTGAFSGTVTNDGIMGVQGKTLNTRLEPRSVDAVLEGAGRVQLTSQRFSRLGDFKTSFTNSKTHNIEGGGLVYGGMINQGTFRADLPGQHLILSQPGQKRNDGLFEAVSGGTLRIGDDVLGSGSYRAHGGTIRLTAPDVSTSVQGASLDISGDIERRSGALEMGEGTTLRLSGAATIYPRGVFDASGDSLAEMGDLVLDGSAATSGIAPPPKLRIGGSAQVVVNGNFSMTGVAQSSNSSSAGMALGGNFDNQSTTESLFDWTNGTLTIYGDGVHQVEISGRDLGPTILGFGGEGSTNFAMGTITVQPGVTVEFLDNVDDDGDPTMCDEALYVHELIVGAGAQITAPNCRVYAEVFQGDMSAVAGMGMCGVAVGFLPTGDIDLDRRVDLQDWVSVGNCLQGPGVQPPVSDCGLTDFDGDGDVDLSDLRWFQTRFTGP